MSRDRKKLTGVLLCVMILGVLCVGIYMGQQKKQMEAMAVPDEEDNSDIISYKGKKYKYNTDIRCVLFLGVDRSEKVEVDSQVGEGGQADTLLLLVLNDKNHMVKVMEISRDTMTEISIYDASGTFLAKEKAQIALQYAYGNSTRKSTQLTKDTVSDLLYKIPIKGAITLDVAGIDKIVDAIDGVKITLQEDASQISPQFVPGAEVVMNGGQAEQFVRYRDTDVAGSNTERMNRQNEFMTALAMQLQGMDEKTLYQLVTGSAGEYIYTELTSDQIEQLSKYTFNGQIESLPGEMRSGEEHDEFYVSDSQLYEKVLDWFYKPVE